MSDQPRFIYSKQIFVDPPVEFLIDYRALAFDRGGLTICNKLDQIPVKLRSLTRENLTW
jgi:hypothetical protein